MRTVFLLTLTILLIACAAPPADVAPDVQDVPQEDALPTDLGLDGLPTADDIIQDCTETIDPQVMLDAFPSTFQSFGEVGDTIAEQEMLPDADGTLLPASTALRTLTINDEQYLSYTGSQACGLHVSLGAYLLLVPVDNEYGWVRETTVDGFPAKIVYDAQLDSYEVQVLVRDTIVIVTRGDLVSEETTLAAAQAIDYASIDAAAP